MFDQYAGLAQGNQHVVAIVGAELAPGDIETSAFPAERTMFGCVRGEFVKRHSERLRSPRQQQAVRPGQDDVFAIQRAMRPQLLAKDVPTADFALDPTCQQVLGSAERKSGQAV